MIVGNSIESILSSPSTSPEKTPESSVASPLDSIPFHMWCVPKAAVEELYAQRYEIFTTKIGILAVSLCCFSDFVILTNEHS